MAMLTRRSTILLLFATFMLASQTDSQTVQQFGQTSVTYAANTNVLNSANSLGVTTGTAFISSNAVSQPGVLFAFSMYVYNTQPVTFQIYRPTGTQLQLIEQLQITPSIQQGREDVYLESFILRNCTSVLRGDRLGVYFQSATPSVVYTFSNNPLSNYINKLQLSTPPVIGLSYTTDQLSLNYVFFATAYYSTSSNTNSGSSSAACPGVKIPGGVVTIPPSTTPYPTGAQGDAGAQGVNGVLGAVGVVGAAGSIGATGSTGATGLQGSLGSTGPSGDQGPLGVQGSTGSTGFTGSAGPTGYMGVPGDTGSTGPVGRMGENLTMYLLTRPPQSTISQSPKLGQDTTSLVWWQTDGAIWHMFLWLAIISFVLLIALVFTIIICCYCSRIEKQSSEKSSSRKNLVKS